MTDQAGRGRGRRVLVVDDHRGIRSLVAATLGKDRFELLEADSGQSALTLARNEHPAVILLDIILPDLDGFEVCRRLKADPATADIKVIMLTAKADDESRRQAQAAGAEAYLIKPFRPSELLQIVGQFLA